MRWVFNILLTGLIILSAGTCLAQVVIVDHTCTDLAQVPEEYLNAAKSQFRVGYAHTSHGSQITTGMSTINAPPHDFNTDGAGGALSYQEYSADLGSWGDLSWVALTRAQLDPPGNDRNLIMWSWCGGVADNDTAGIDAYLSAMNQLEIDYPGVRFVYMTGHLDGSGVYGGLNVRNNQIRDYCRANNKVLFDFADIESYDPSGAYYLDRGANDNCDYDGGNWAQQWCAANPGSDLCANCGSPDCCAHSQPLNCNLKGRAFWWMMAVLAGWQGGPGPGPSPTPAPSGFPLTLRADKQFFSAAFDSITIFATVQPTSNFTPYVRIATPYGAYYYVTSGGALVPGSASGGAPYMQGLLTLGSALNDYMVATFEFSNVAPGTYQLQGALVGNGGVIGGIFSTDLTVQ
jgi:hypothetical protein